MKIRVLTAGLIVMLAGTAWGQETPAKAAPATVKATAGQPEKAKDQAEEKKLLVVGDKAPPLTIEKWVKGEPVTGFEKGRVYIVEFWATWCGPCIAGMPHLTEVQKEYKAKGVTVIGVTSKDRTNSLEAVEAMVKDKGDEKMGYTVAWDKERTTNKAYMSAAEQNGIPCAFIVNQEGVIAYIGHPMAMDDALEEIVAGKYDMKAAAAKYKEDRAAEMKANEERAAAAKEMAPIYSAIQADDFDGAVKLIDAKLAEKPKSAKQLAFLKWNVLAMSAKQYDKAYAWANEAAEKYFTDKTDAMMLNTIAWTILDDEAIEKRDPKTALNLAKRASEFTGNKDGMILDTLALAYFETGDVTKAVETQRKAVEAAQGDSRMDEDTMDEIKGRLEKFEKAAKEKK